MPPIVSRESGLFVTFWLLREPEMEILLLFVVDCAWMLPFAVIVWLFVKFVMVKRSPLKVVWALFVRAPRWLSRRY